MESDISKYFSVRAWIVDLIRCINCILLVIMLNGLPCARGVGRGEFASFTTPETWRPIWTRQANPKTVGQRSAGFFFLLIQFMTFFFLPLSFHYLQFQWITNAFIPSQCVPGTSSHVQISLARKSQFTPSRTQWGCVSCHNGQSVLQYWMVVSW